MLEPLSQAKQSNIQEKSASISNLDRSPTEQLERNQALQAVLRQWLDEELTPEESTARAETWKNFKDIVDRSRSHSHKLYS
jgi:hypothetical protein